MEACSVSMPCPHQSSLPISTTLKSHQQNSILTSIQFPQIPKTHPQNMSILKLLLATLSLSLLCLHTNDAVSVLELQNALKTGEVDPMVKRVCTEKVEDCLEGEEMESESNRRVVLMRRRYISYETLRRDMVPCQKPGASYYDCNAHTANPYSRGCEIITRCARGIKG